MRNELIDLINRMLLTEESHDSEKSISWQAHREAENLNNLEFIPELYEFINKNKKSRKAAYFIIGKIGKNTLNTECANLLIKYASTEKDKYILSYLLDLIAKIPKEINENLTPIFTLLSDKRWLVRYSAIRALINTKSSVAEQELITLLKSTNDPNDLVYCYSTLNKIGTEISLPFIELGLQSRKRDVKSSAIQAIASIKQRAQQVIQPDT